MTSEEKLKSVKSITSTSVQDICRTVFKKHNWAGWCTESDCQYPNCGLRSEIDEWRDNKLKAVLNA